MRRGFSILLIVLFGLGPLSVMIDGSEDAGLPACCRRHGEHHCAIAMGMAARLAQSPDPRPSFTIPLTCPNYPGPALAILIPAHALVTEAAGWEGPRVVAPAAVAEQAEAHSTPSRSHAGRGPPETNLS